MELTVDRNFIKLLNEEKLIHLRQFNLLLLSDYETLNNNLKTGRLRST